MSTSSDPTLERIIHWGESQDTVRAMLLTSTLAIPNGPVDALSDYDVILVVRDILPFFAGRDWLEAFGPVLAMYRDPLLPYMGYQNFGNVTQYESGLKIDFTLWSVEILQAIVAAPQLPTELDAGYRILLDKDGLTAGLQPPTYKGYIPDPPDEAAYFDRIECFFQNACYVAKYIWRGDLMAANFILNSEMKHADLLPMLEWLVELDHDWKVSPGPLGRRLQRWLRPELWTELKTTYTGIEPAESWEALYRLIDLMRKVSLEVGERLGFTYPHDMDRKTLAHLEHVRSLPPGASWPY